MPQRMNTNDRQILLEILGGVCKINKKRKTWYFNHRDINGTIERLCSDCNEWRTEDETNFYLQNKSKQEKGFQSVCRKCVIKRNQKRQEENPEKYQEYKHNHYIKNFDMWYERRKRHKEEDYEKYAVAEKIWQENNPAKVKEYQQKRMFHKKHQISGVEWFNCKEYFKDDSGKWCCAYCELSISNHTIKRNGKLINSDFHKEHVDDQGSNEIDNCVPSCYSCNSSKKKYTLDEWYNPNNKRLKSGVFSEDRKNKIIKWISGDWKLSKSQ